MIKHRLLVALFASMAITGWSQDSAIIVESFRDGHNNDGFSAVEGRWTESVGKSTADGVKATKAYFNDANAEAAVARFTPNLPVAGKYEVLITYPAQGNASDVKHTITSADGTNTISLTQNGREPGHTPAANQWHSLGVYNFEAGSKGYLELSDPQTGEFPLPNEPNARIYADAVKFVPVDASVPVTPAGAAPAPSASAVATETTASVVTTETVVATAPSTDTMSALPGAEVPAEIPSLPTEQIASAATTLPGLPGAAAATSPALPPLPAADPGAALPSLPGTTPAAGAALPSLPATTPAGANLPSLPAAAPAAANPALPSLPADVNSAAALPSLPAGSPATPAPGLPPADSAAGLPTLPGAATPTPATTPAATPAPALETPSAVTNLPSLAPVTPTPLHTLPSPSDTPVPVVPTMFPGITYTPAAVTPMAGVGVPTPITGGAALPTATPAGTPAGYSVTMYNPSNLQWMYDFGAAMNSARAQGKKVFVFFTAEHNKAAQSYETETFADPTVRQELSKYILVKVDFPRNTRLAYGLGVFGAGVIAVVDESGQVTSRVVQKPPTSADLLTQLSTTRPVRATPAPVPQGGQAEQTPDAGFGALPQAAPGEAAGMSSAPADAFGGAMPGMPVPAAGTPSIVAPAAGTPGFATPAAAVPAGGVTPAGDAGAGQAAPAAAPEAPTGPAADSLPELPGL